MGMGDIERFVIIFLVALSITGIPAVGGPAVGIPAVGGPAAAITI